VRPSSIARLDYPAGRSPGRSGEPVEGTGYGGGSSIYQPGESSVEGRAAEHAWELSDMQKANEHRVAYLLRDIPGTTTPLEPRKQGGL